MIMITRNKKEEIKELQKMVEVMKMNPISKLVYTVAPCLVKSALINPTMKVNLKDVKVNDYILVMDFATYIDALGDKNDSPGGKPITFEESKANCDRLYKELGELYEKATI